ncbi:MAG: DNA-processing protein DprA [Candidatus Yanofskybacteria bacterium]|nr:DNA-processing protein DprA [Candidatus Yanofskybacteria bacterium]
MKPSSADRIDRNNPDYPELLSHIYNPPSQLYYRGNIAILKNPCLGVVGTRKLSSYGEEVTRFIVNDLVRAGLTIVSGLALGIDAVAHDAALEAGGLTIAVLGSGVDDQSIYPRTNLRLSEKIIARGGLIISEYPEGSKPRQFTFPMRNRIISGLSRGVVVIEADKQSGALITARCALEQNRDVFAVPGSIFAPRSTGPNILMGRGAKAVLSAADILEEYPDLKLINHFSPKTISTQNSVEKKIIAILQDNGPTAVDVLIRNSGEDTSVVLATASILEIRGIIVKNNNSYHIKK